MIQPQPPRKWQVWIVKVLDKWVYIAPNLPPGELNEGEQKERIQAVSRGIGLVCKYINRCKNANVEPDLKPNDEIPRPPHGVEVIRMNST